MKVILSEIIPIKRLLYRLNVKLGLRHKKAQLSSLILEILLLSPYKLIVYGLFIKIIYIIDSVMSLKHKKITNLYLLTFCKHF